MRRIIPLALLLSATALPAQSFYDASFRVGPQFHSYEIKAPINEKVSEIAFPIFVVVPVLPSLTVDVGTAFAMARVERTATGSVSELSGLTDTQLRANYTLGADFVVITAGLNLPTGSATVDPEKVEAAARIGSDFLAFPISSFGSGLGMTGGVAVARPAGDWNFGFGASMRRSSEYEPFRDAEGAPFRFQPGSEYRLRLGADRAYGTGRIGFGLTFSKFGDDEANGSVYNTGDRYIGQFSINNSLNRRADYSFVMWNLMRPGGTSFDQSDAPLENITNTMLIFGLRGPADVSVEPSIEARVWAAQKSRTSWLTTLGMRFLIDRGGWAIVPGAGFTIGTLDAATLSGFRGTLAIRLR